MKYNQKDIDKAVLALRKVVDVSSMTHELFDAILGDDTDNLVFEPWDNIATDIYLHDGGIIIIPSMCPLDESLFEDSQNEATNLIIAAYNA